MSKPKFTFGDVFSHIDPDKSDKDYKLMNSIENKIYQKIKG